MTQMIFTDMKYSNHKKKMKWEEFLNAMHVSYAGVVQSIR